MCVCLCASDESERASERARESMKRGRTAPPHTGAAQKGESKSGGRRVVAARGRTVTGERHPAMGAGQGEVLPTERSELE
mmetsp:Transcript_5699/g.11334  ORF Transcript_5699/g.11334 Transcript_5699/m.11334 type:complete len:80 (-) Transcript_5699:248-487(-)